MTDEERRRTMDFILQQQAKFAADMQRMAERHVQFGADMEKVAEQQARFGADVERLEESDRIADRRLTRLENVVRLAIRAGLRERRERREERKEWLERLNALIDAQMGTEEIVRRNSEDISRLSRIVERGAEGRNGGGKTGEDGEG